MPPDSNGISVVETSSHAGEWADEFFEDTELKVDGDEVVITIGPYGAVHRGDVEHVAIIWEGGLDFEGTASEARERYPDLAEWLPPEDIPVGITEYQVAGPVFGEGREFDNLEDAEARQRETRTDIEHWFDGELIETIAPPTL